MGIQTDEIARIVFLFESAGVVDFKENPVYFPSELAGVVKLKVGEATGKADCVTGG